MEVHDFFEIYALDSGPVDVAGVTIERTEWDQCSVICDGQSLDVDLSECQEIMPPYPLHP